MKRWRNIWQLHIPLVLVLSLCTVLTVIEARRAGEGVWRAWAYTFEWPLIALFTFWIWNRYRKEGSIPKGLVEKWRRRVEELNAEADRQEGESSPADPELVAWESYVADLQRRDPPGRSPRHDGPDGQGS